MPAAVVEAVGTGHAMLHARVTLADDTLMPAVRAYMVIAAAADLGTVVASAPEVDHVEAFDGRRVDVWVAAGVEAAALSAALTSVPDVATAEVAEVAEAGASAAAEPVAPVPVPVVAGERSEAGRAAATVRVDAERLDQLMHLMGELVVQRTQVEVLAAQAEVPGLSQAMQDLTRCSHALQAIVMQVRMIPVEAVFLRFPRLVRDLSSKLGKQVELELVGQDTELDRTVVDALGDPLVHLVRNALDHGLETPAEREAAGKPPAGTVRISARHAGGNVVITVADDGRGVDRHAVAAKAVRAGLITAEQADAIDMARAIELLFAPGFSTRDQADDISGRGVGMDAVRAKVRELGGEVLLTSEPGAGTTAQIRLPLTLAIMSALLVRAGGRVFGIALDRIDRTVRLADHPVRSAAGQRMLVVGDAVLPALRRRRRARPPARRRLRVRRHRAEPGAQHRAGRLDAHRPARARHPPAARRPRRAGPRLRRRRPLRRRDRPARGLRRPHDRHPGTGACAPPERNRTSTCPTPATPTCSSTPCASSRTSAPAPPGRRSRRCSAARSSCPCPVRRPSSWPRRSRPPARPRTSCGAWSCRSPARSTRRRCWSSATTTRATLCAMLGVEADTDTGRSALGEIGNIMVSSYVGALATMTGFELDLRPPQSTRDMLGAVVASVLAAHSDAHELALVLDSELEVAGEACTLSFMLLPTPAGVAELLHRIGLGD